MVTATTTAGEQPASSVSALASLDNSSSFGVLKES